MFQAVVFDFDLTLADSSVGVAECIAHALHHLGLPPVSAERMHTSIGLSLTATFTYLTGKNDPQAAAAFARAFVQRADQVMTELTVLYPAVPEVLTRLRAEGFGLGIVSSKFRYRIAEILTRAGLLRHFDVIVEGEDVARHKPHPEGLRRALAHFACAPHHLVYVGDHPVDAEAASQAGVPFVAVLTGAAERSHFTTRPSLGIIENLHALPRLLYPPAPTATWGQGSQQP